MPTDIFDCIDCFSRISMELRSLLLTVETNKFSNLEKYWVRYLKLCNYEILYHVVVSANKENSVNIDM